MSVERGIKMLNAMKELIEELNIASDKYYNTGSPVMSDKEFDAKLDTLKELEERLGIVLANSPTQNVGAPVLNELNKIDISDKPMLSLNKCHTADEIKEFAKGQNLIASIKCDGLSVRIIYEDGKIVSANTRGNGEIGQDITEHIKHFINVPLHIPTTSRLVVDGEAVILKKDFDEINAGGEFKNPRNLASGTLASLDTSLCNSRRLSFILWDVIEYIQPIRYYHEGIQMMSNYGFTVVPWQFCLSSEDSWTYNNINNKMLKVANEKGIPCDGIVWKYADVIFDTTRTAKFFNNGIAFKFKDEEAETRLKYITYEPSRNGILTPVAVFEPVDIEGSVVERASLHNLSIMEELLGEPYAGQKLTIFKANQIIPQVKSAVKMKYADIVKNCGVIVDGTVDGYLQCPSCGTVTAIKESEDGVKTIHCPNDLCPSKVINIINHFCSKEHGLDVKGLSKATIAKLLEFGWIERRADVFKLYTKQKEWENLPGFGRKSVENILNAIEAAKNTNFESYLSSLGIPLIGRTVSKELAKIFSNYNDFRKAIKERYDFTQLNGFGVEMDYALITYDYTEADEIAVILNFEEKSAETVTESLKGKTFVITGKSSLGSRDKVKALIESAGGKVTSSVSAKTDYLVANAKEDTSKYNNAIKYGTTIINDEKLMEMLK